MWLNWQHFLPAWLSGSKVVAVKPAPTTDFNSNATKQKTVQWTDKATAVSETSFHYAFRPILQMAHFIALMPLRGLWGPSVSSLYFAWCTFPTLYCIVVFIGTSIYTLLTILRVTRHEVQADSIVPIIFFVNVGIAQVCFIHLARRWPRLMAQWDQVESQLPGIRTSISRKFKVISMTIMLLSLSEHILNIISIATISTRCNPNDTDPIRSYFLMEQAQLYEFFEYSPVKTFFCKVLTLITTFVWTFMDLILILVSVGLSTQFQQINRSLMLKKGKLVPEKFWADHRIIYRKLCNLSYDVDAAFSVITLLSFGNNLFFVCIKLADCFNKLPSNAHAAYFWFSLLFLIARTLSVLLFLSQIHDEAKKPLQVFRMVPREGWCEEVKRFAAEVTHDQVALSGMRFFHVTRKLVMSVAGTIVTYELVLLQFGGDDDLDDDDDC